jgi:hypothetical protein
MTSFIEGVHCCFVEDNYTTYAAKHKNYLGRKRAEVTNIQLSGSIVFTTTLQLRTFYDWYKNTLKHGGDPFYVTLPIFGTVETVVVQFIGDLVVSEGIEGGKCM